LDCSARCSSSRIPRKAPDLIWFILQFVLCYGATVLAGSKSLSEVWIIAVTFGIVALPFGLIAGGPSRLFERAIGWPGAIPAVILMLLAMYLIARNKVNYTEASGTNVPAVVFAGVWSLLSWRHALAAA